MYDVFAALRTFDLWIGKDLSIPRMTIRPAVILKRLGAESLESVWKSPKGRKKPVECLIRLLGTKMIRTLIRGVKRVSDPFEADGISQPLRDLSLFAAVRIHFNNARPDILFFLARVTARTHRNIELAVSAE